MSYSTINFILFVLGTVLVYFLIPKKVRWTVLLAASVVFYIISGWKSRDDKKKYKNKIKVQKRLVMTLALLANFGILAFMKYYNSFAGGANELAASFGWQLSVPTLKLLMPLGISFYTFQSMGYIVDVYREKVRAQKNPLKLLLFVSFFPQVIQGPISMYDQLAKQLYEGHDFDFTRFKYGCELIMWGFFKKLVIADRAAIAITAVTDKYNSYNGTTLTFTILLYSLQLYADFSGGIDISRGVSQIFGIDMIDNFKRPYFSKDINEYWRRWHISLGAWMKEYIFYPVAMSNLFITASKKMKNTRFGGTAAGAHIAKVLPTSVASLIVFLVMSLTSLLPSGRRCAPSGSFLRTRISARPTPRSAVSVLARRTISWCFSARSSSSLRASSRKTLKTDSQSVRSSTTRPSSSVSSRCLCC